MLREYKGEYGIEREMGRRKGSGFDPQLGRQWGLGFLEASNVRVSGKLGLILEGFVQWGEFLPLLNQRGEYMD